MSYEVSVVANYHKGEAFPFQLLIFLFTHNYLNTRTSYHVVTMKRTKHTLRVIQNGYGMTYTSHHKAIE